MKRYFPLGGDLFVYVFVRNQTPRVYLRQTTNTSNGVEYTPRGISLSWKQLNQLFNSKKMILSELNTCKNKLYGRRQAGVRSPRPCPSQCPKCKTLESQRVSKQQTVSRTNSTLNLKSNSEQIRSMERPVSDYPLEEEETEM